jgi:ubiquinone/menaquinone biosynthesis C-methylase UbiE
MPFEPPPRENTYVLDPESATEQVRILHQDRMVTKCMGGPLNELEPSTISQMQSILDLACGPGAWVLDMAYEYPQIQVTGIDISRRMIEYGQESARSQNVGNATFHSMSVLEPFGFEDNSFDLVNARAMFGFMSRGDWPKLVKESMRVLKPGGILRLTEIEFGISNSPALEKLNGFFLKALQVTGRSFSPDGRNLGITPMLSYFLREAGFEHIRKVPHLLDASFGSEDHGAQVQNIALANKGLQPFLVKMGMMTDEALEQTYQQSLDEMQVEDFCSLWYFLTVWGQKPV